MTYEEESDEVDYPEGEAPPVQWDVANMTRDLIDSEWREDVVNKPEKVELYTEDEEGDTRKKVRRDNEYVHVAEVQNREIEYTDLFQNTENLSAACFVEFSTPVSRQRRELMFHEIKNIATEHRKRPDTPGNWDTLEVNAEIYDDENFGWWMGRFTFSYSRKKHVID